jgi:psiF repeat
MKTFIAALVAILNPLRPAVLTVRRDHRLACVCCAASSRIPPSDHFVKPLSKACSDQATAKGLHGKERRTFRSACKRNGGKAA